MTGIRRAAVVAVFTLPALAGCTKPAENTAPPHAQEAAMSPSEASPQGSGGDSSDSAAAMAMAPAVTVVDAAGQPVELAQAWAQGPAVVVFYRGHWCGFCRKQFGELQARLPEIQSLGANLVAVSAAADDPAKMKEKSGASFPLYADPELAAIKAWHVLDADNEISKPATFVIDREGTIVYRYVGADKGDRPVLDEVVAALNELPRG